MKADIHPEYHTFNVTCVCGNSWEASSVAKFEKVDICNNCHPFYTGQQRVMDTEGRIEKFRKKYAKFEKKK